MPDDAEVDPLDGDAVRGVVDIGVVVGAFITCVGLLSGNELGLVDDDMIGVTVCVDVGDGVALRSLGLIS